MEMRQSGTVGLVQKIPAVVHVGNHRYLSDSLTGTQ